MHPSGRAPGEGTRGEKDDSGQPAATPSWMGTGQGGCCPRPVAWWGQEAAAGQGFALEQGRGRSAEAGSPAWPLRGPVLSGAGPCLQHRSPAPPPAGQRAPRQRRDDFLGKRRCWEATTAGNNPNPEQNPSKEGWEMPSPGGGTYPKIHHHVGVLRGSAGSAGGPWAAPGAAPWWALSPQALSVQLQPPGLAPRASTAACPVRSPPPRHGVVARHGLPRASEPAAGVRHAAAGLSRARGHGKGAQVGSGHRHPGARSSAGT